MPRSTDSEADERLLGRLLEAVERELPRAVELRHRLHGATGARARGAVDGGDRCRRSCRCGARETVAGTGRMRAAWARRGGRAVAVRAELDGRARCASARARRSAPAERRCTRAGTTCTWPRWWRWPAPRTRSATRCRRRCWRLFQPSEEAYRRAPSSSRAASSHGAPGARWSGGARAPGAAVGRRGARPRHGERLLRRVPRSRSRASPRTAPTRTADATPCSRWRRSWSRCTPAWAGASTRSRRRR